MTHPQYRNTMLQISHKFGPPPGVGNGIYCLDLVTRYTCLCLCAAISLAAGSLLLVFGADGRILWIDEALPRGQAMPRCNSPNVSRSLGAGEWDLLP